MSDPLAELRAQVTANDERIVALVNERLRLVEELWRVKARGRRASGSTRTASGRSGHSSKRQTPGGSRRQGWTSS